LRGDPQGMLMAGEGPVSAMTVAYLAAAGLTEQSVHSGIPSAPKAAPGGLLA